MSPNPANLPLSNLDPISYEIDAGPLSLLGAIPDGLRGMLVRNGPNSVIPDPHAHWFFGDGMLHAFRIQDGQVRYRNRWVRTAHWEHARRNAHDPCGGSLQGQAEGARLTADDGVANTSIIQHAGRVLALEEEHLPIAIDAVTLATLGTEDFSGLLTDRFTAHPKTDPRTGELLFSDGTPELSNGMSFGIVSPRGEVTRLERFAAPYASMVHDFAITAEHVLFPIMPLTASRERAQAGGPPFAWEPEHRTRVGIMPRSGTTADIQWWTGPACFVFHVMNAWDSGGRVFMDVIQFDRPPLFPLPDGSPAAGPDEPGRLVRWTFDLADRRRRFTQTPLCDVSGEFPRIDERRTGLPYRHGWFAGDTCENAIRRESSSIVHIDHTSAALDMFTFPARDHVSEPVFVPATSEEGAGWILAVVWRSATSKSDLVIFDARQIARGPICVASLPSRMPDGFHGNWFPLP